MTLKELDNKLMWFLTMHNIPKRFKTPFSQFLFTLGFNLLFGTLLVYSTLNDGRAVWLTYIIGIGFSLSILYQWRLWRRQEKDFPK